MKKNENVVLIGSGGHAVVISEIFQLSFSGNITVVERNGNKRYLEVHQDYSDRFKLKEDHCFHVGLGDNGSRQELQLELEKDGFLIISAIHPRAVVSKSSILGKGVAIMANAVINPFVTLGDGVIINTGAILDHHTSVGSYSHIAPGVSIAGNCRIGSKVMIGVGTSISNDIVIVDNVIVGAGAVVVKSILEPGTYVGVPAKKIK